MNKGASLLLCSILTHIVPNMNTGLARLHNADKALRLFNDKVGVTPPKPDSTRNEPVGEPDKQEIKKIFNAEAETFLLRDLNKSNPFKIETQEKNGNNAGSTLEIKSSKPLAAPFMEAELNIMIETQSSKHSMVNTVFIR